MTVTEARPTDVIDRTTYLGGSDIAAILGWNKYRTPLDVYNDKLGLVPPFAGNPHTERGNALEKIAADEFTKRTGFEVMRRNLALRHGVYPFLGGHIDRKVVGQPAIVEIKCPSLGSFAKIKREGLPENYIAQLQWYLGLGDYEWGQWVIFCADQWDMVTFRVDFDGALYQSMVERAVAFWQTHVLAKLPPEPRKEDEARIEIARAEGQYPLVERTDPDFVEALGQVAEAKQLAAEAEALEEAAKARVLELIESKPGIYVTDRARLSFTPTKGRSSFDQKALAAAEPLDHAKVIASVRGLLVNGLAMTDDEIIAANIRSTLAGCGLDLKQFTKVGAPGTQFRVTTLGGGRD